MVRFSRFAAAIIAVTAIGLLIAGGGLYLLLRGEAVESSYLGKRIQAAIQRGIGPEYELAMAETSVGFDADGNISLSGRNVSITSADGDYMVSHVGSIHAGLRFWSVIFGEPQLASIIVENATMDASTLGLLAGTGGSTEQPRTLDEILTALHDGLSSVDSRFADNRLQRILLSNIELQGLPKWRRSDGPLTIKRLLVRRGTDDAIALDANLATDHSDFLLAGSYDIANDGIFDLSIEGLSLREWAESPDSNIGPFGSRSQLTAIASIPLSRDAETPDPTFAVSITPGTVRIGRNGRTDVEELSLSMRLDREANRFELVPSPLRAGGFQASLAGFLTPVDEARGIFGDWRFELAANPASGEPTAEGEPSVETAIRTSGFYRADSRVIDAESFRIEAGDDQLVGSAMIGLTGPTPSLQAELSSESIDMAAFRQIWPFWIAPPVRDWIHAHATGGGIRDFSIVADVPPGVLGRLRHGEKMEPDEFLLKMAFDGLSISTFGDMPAIDQAKGRFELHGMKAQVQLDAGRVEAGDFGEAEVTGGRFTVEDIAKRPNEAEIQISLSGAARTLAGIVDSNPVNALQKMKLAPGNVTGSGHLDVIANVPLAGRVTPEEVDWLAMVDLQDASSSKAVFGRKISDADVNVEVTPKSARIMGTAVVDGTRTKLEMTEPLGGSKVASVRNYSAVLDNEARRRMGLSLDEIVDGKIEVSVDQIDKNSQVQRLDLENAELNLPWIGWSKGRSIPANASYIMIQRNGRTTLDNFYMEGDGFSAAGSMVFDDKGILSADFADISLNEGDSYALRLERKGNTFDIQVSGVRMDARGLINKLFHQGGFGDAQGETNIELTANLGQVRGFNGQVLRNATIRYGTTQGWFDNLSLRGSFSPQTYVNVFATTENRKTTFEVDSNDAGATLSFTNVYRRMLGGKLRASLVRDQGGAFVGPVRATNFVVNDEPRLKSIVSNPPTNQADRGASYQEVQRRLSEVDTQRVTFIEARADIEKSTDAFRVKDGVLTGAQIGFTFEGLLYDGQNRMNLSGTFLPAVAISRAIGFIPIVGELLGNGRDSGLIGITFRLSGPSKNPTLELNPISVVAPGIFRKVFEYRE